MKKITLNLGDYGQYFKPIKPVKRSYKKSAKGASVKAPKASSKKASTKKAPRTKASTAKGVSVKKTKAPKNPSKPTKPKKTAEQIEYETALRESRAADRSKAHDWDKALEADLRAAEKDYRRAKKEYQEAKRKEREEQRAERKRERLDKAIDITTNKLEAEYGRIETDEEYIDRSIAAIAEKVNEYYNTSSDRREMLSDITGLDMKDFDMGNPTKRKQALVAALYNKMVDDEGYIDVEPTMDKVTEIYRGLESFNRKERLHAKGIEMDMDEETAKDIMLDILNSDKVSAETKEVLRILGPKGALLYVNYRQIQRLKYGDLYREQLYAPAAEVFWDDSEADKVLLKKFGYRFARKTAQMINDSGVGTAGHIDATQFQKFAMTKMSYDEAVEFLKKISESHI